MAKLPTDEETAKAVAEMKAVSEAQTARRLAEERGEVGTELTTEQMLLLLRQEIVDMKFKMRQQERHILQLEIFWNSGCAFGFDSVDRVKKTILQEQENG